MTEGDEGIKDLIREVIREVHSTSIPLSRDDAANIALAAAKEAVRQDHEAFFGILGYDIANKEDQKRLRAVMDFSAAFYDGTKSAQSRVVQVSVGTMIAAFFYVLYLGIKIAITGKAFN